VVRDRATGYSYGFGFIDYATEDEAARAVNALNGSQLQHKRIKVAFSRQVSTDSRIIFKKQKKLEIWGTVQREAARGRKSDWRDNLKAEILLLSKH